MTWQNTRLKFLAGCPIQNGLGESGGEDNPDWPRYIRTTDIAGPRELRDDVFASLPPVVAKKALLRPGDLLMTAAGATIGKSVLYLDNGPACYAGYLVRFRPRRGINPRFIAYWTESSPYWDQIRSGRVVSTIENFSASKYQNLRLSIPPFATQQSIADYLDRETTRIDALIAAKRRMVELLDERLQGSISASTQARSAVDSSHPLPNGWTLMPLKRCLSSTAYGIGESAQAEGEYAVLGMTNISSGEVVGTPGGFVSAVAVSLLLAPGDLLFNRTNSRELVGKVGLVRSLERPTTFASYLVRLRANRLANAQYLNYLLNAAEVLGLARSTALPSIGQANLNPNRYSTMMLPIPPAHQQRSLVSHLDALASRAISIRRTLERQVALLRERRQALVTAAVTGQFEIPEAA